MDEAYEYNLSSSFFKKRRLHEAVEMDPFFCDTSFEWCRTIRRKTIIEQILCCPEDVQTTSACSHAETHICSKCDIPICRECWGLLVCGQKIPKALTNDNFISYIHRYIVENSVTWLEATIACPIFTGLITYYIEGLECPKIFANSISWGSLY